MASIESRLTELARLYGAQNLVIGMAWELGGDTPEDFGVADERGIAVDVAVARVLAMAPGVVELEKVLASGDLEVSASIACGFDEECPHGEHEQVPAGSLVMIDHLLVADGVMHSISERGCILATYETMAEALRFAADRGLEVARHCGCYAA